jgi:hypothetical protein
MKIDRITPACLRLALILLAVLLVKLIISVPLRTFAQVDRSLDARQYKVSAVNEEFAAYVAEQGKRKLDWDWWAKLAPGERWTAVFNWNAARGWTYHGAVSSDGDLFLIFAR